MLSYGQSLHSRSPTHKKASQVSAVTVHPLLKTESQAASSLRTGPLCPIPCCLPSTAPPTEQVLGKCLLDSSPATTM